MRDLAHVLHEAIQAFPGRTFRQYLTTNYHYIKIRGVTGDWVCPLAII